MVKKQFNVRLESALLERLDAWLEALNAGRRIKLQRSDLVRGVLDWAAETRPAFEGIGLAAEIAAVEREEAAVTTPAPLAPAPLPPEEPKPQPQPHAFAPVRGSASKRCTRCEAWQHSDAANGPCVAKKGGG